MRTYVLYLSLADGGEWGVNESYEVSQNFEKLDDFLKSSGLLPPISSEWYEDTGDLIPGKTGYWLPTTQMPVTARLFQYEVNKHPDFKLEVIKERGIVDKAIELYYG